MVTEDEHVRGDQPGIRDCSGVLDVDRQFVLVSDEFRGSVPPTASDRLPAHEAEPRPSTCLEMASDACVAPVNQNSVPVARADLGNRGRLGGDGSACTREPVTIPDRIARGYHGFTDEVLRPVGYSAVDRTACGDDRWESYLEVNERVATTVADLAADDAVVWTVDPHFAPLARRLRSALSDEAFLFQYWPVPWPPWDTLRARPRAEAILESLLDNDLIGFDVPRYRDNFLRTVDTLVSGAVVDRASHNVDYDSSLTAVRAVPKGISADRVGTLAVSHAADGFAARFRDAHGIAEGRPIVVVLDGDGDGTGLVRCLRALERHWSDTPSERGRFTLVHLDGTGDTTASSPGSETRDTTRAVERVDERFGTDEWRPVVTRTERLSDGERYALYRDAAVGVAAPIRGTGIPETQEFVAAQSADPGVLLVSTETQTVNGLERDALTFSPFEYPSFVRRLDEGLRSGPETRSELMSDLTRRIRAYDDETWLQYVSGLIVGIERRRVGDTSV
jgi:trehalose 6-phosphate synthase